MPFIPLDRGVQLNSFAATVISSPRENNAARHVI
jgi:hypothetical protein